MTEFESGPARNLENDLSDNETFINNSDYDESPRKLEPAMMAPPTQVRSPEKLRNLLSNNDNPDGSHTVSETEDIVTQNPKSKRPQLNPLLAVRAKLENVTPPADEAVSTPHKEQQSLGVRAQASRLVIDKLVLTNFKSYAGTQEIGPFNTSFSAVVGPNGSGKSNVIDSLLFVFGFRALKMRQGKLSELIHNSDGKRLDYCQVDIHFSHVVDDPVVVHKVLVVPNSLIVISRRATLSNQSQYFINNKTSSYTEVTTYLRKEGIDLDHKRFLILQGEVESIAQMRPKAEKENDDGLLEYLEDIIGTSQYKPLIDQSLEQVEELNQICVEKENRFEVVQQDTTSLEDRKTEALRFLELETNMVNKRSIKFQVQIHKESKILADNEAKLSAIDKKLQGEIDKNRHLNADLDRNQLRKRAIVKSLDELTKEDSAISKKQKQVNSQIVSLEEKLKNFRNKSKKLQKAKQIAESALSENSMKLENMNRTNAEVEKELQTLNELQEQEKTILNDLRSKLTQKTAHLSKQIEDLRVKLEPFYDQVKEKDSALELIQSRINILETEKSAADNRLRELSKRLVSIKEEGKAKEQLHESLELKLSHIDEQITLGEEQCASTRQMLESKKVRLASARQKTLDASAFFSNLKNKNQVLVNLQRLARSGRISGFHGRLGDLGVIDDKYDVAISTACPGLDSMVVDTVETAQTCIDYLRKNKLGFANFICLNKLRKFDLSPISTPGNPLSVKRLFDLIEPQSDIFRPAFYSKLYNTLVATNLQEAKSVAYGPKRFKVVTIDGKVVDTSGTMSGGGHSMVRGGMQLKSNTVTNEYQYSESDIQKMQEELRYMETEVALLQSEFLEMETNLRKLRDFRPETELAIQTAQLDIDALVQEKREVSATCKELIAERERANESSEFKSAIADKQSELKLVQAEKEQLKLQMIDSETRIVSLEEKIMEAGGVELKVQNSKVDLIKQKIEIIREKTSGDVVIIKKLENEVKRHQVVIENCNRDLKQFETEEGLLVEALDRLNKELTELNLKHEKVSNEKNEFDSEIEKLTEEYEGLSSKINDLKSEEIELRNQLEKLTSTIKRVKRNIAEAEESLSMLIPRDYLPYIDWMPEQDRSRYLGSEVAQLSEDEIESVRLDIVEEEVAELENYMNNVKVDIEVLKEYGEKMKELEVRRSDLNSSVLERDTVKGRCEELKRKRFDEFMEGFNTISLSLKEMYQMITMGGNAELELVDSLDPFSEGILFSVMPPKKSWKNISNLSGGEKTLSSLALVFALHRYKPTPLYVMDEIDAALDFRNVSIVANYIKERTKNGQFIVISLRNNMFELAQQLVGIYKVNNRTQSISLKNRELIGSGVA